MSKRGDNLREAALVFSREINGKRNLKIEEAICKSAGVLVVGMASIVDAIDDTNEDKKGEFNAE